MMINIASNIFIDMSELQFSFIRASGPGGQNVNKVASAVQLRFNVKESNNLPEEIKERLLVIAKNKINDKGELIIDARRFRTQIKNRKDAVERLIQFIQKATEVPRQRKATRPSRAAHERRLEAKQIQSAKKQTRKKIKYL